MNEPTPQPDPREMRKAIMQAAYRGDRVDGKNSPWNISIAAPMVRAIVHGGEAQGWSGEDVMTALAYHALRRLEEFYDKEILLANTMPPQPFVVKA